MKQVIFLVGTWTIWRRAAK